MNGLFCALRYASNFRLVMQLYTSDFSDSKTVLIKKKNERGT